MKLNSPQQRSTPTRVSLPSMIDALEPRRLLAVFAGTENSDTIRITRVGSFTHVNINNNDFATTDSAINISALGGNDFVLMDYVHPGIVINCGAGNDRVTYGGPSRDIFGDLPQTLLIGDAGTDTVNFDDSGGPSDIRRDFLFTDVAAMNQVLFDFEDLIVQPRNSNLPSKTEFTGFPVSQSVSLAGVVLFGRSTYFGTESEPIDLDNYDLDVKFDHHGWSGVHVYDQDADVSANPFRFYTTSNRLQQHLAKGNFHIAFADDLLQGDLTLHAGSTNDSFGIGGISWDEQNFSAANIEIFAGAGDDSLYSTNDNGHLNDWDEIHVAGTLRFSGEAGLDLVNLNDSADQVGDNDENYFVRSNSVSKGPGSGSIILLDGATTERVSVVADADNNAITFQTANTQLVTLNGGLGSDTFGIVAGTELQDCRGITNLIGGSGTDSFSVADDNPAFQSLRQYSFNSTSFAYADAAGPRGTITYNTMESFAVDENAANGTTFVLGRPAGMQLSITGNGGDDTFTIGGGDLDSNGFFQSGITLSGGTGNDSIVFDDRLDRDAAGETENYTFGNLSLAKGALILVYSTFENQTLLAADGIIVGQLNTVPSVNLNSISGFLNSTTIVGGPSRSCIVNVGNGDLINLSGIINVNLNGGFLDRFTVSDQLSSGATSSYEVNNSQVRKTSTGQTINYSGVTQIVLNTRDSASVPDSINVRGVPAGLSLIVNANSGNDHFFLGGGNFSDFLLGPVTLNGATGTDDVNFINSLDASPSAHTLTSTTFTDVVTHTYTGMDLVRFSAGPGGSALAVNSLAVAAELTGGAGNDAFTIGNGSLALALGANIAVNGGGGNDSMNLLGQNDGGVNTYAFPAFNQFRFGDTSTGKFITFSGLEQATLRSGLGPDTIDVSTASIPLSILSGTGNDAVTVSASTVPVTVDTGPEQDVPFGFRAGDLLNIGFVSTFPASVVVAQSDTVLTLSVVAASILRLANNAVLTRVTPSFLDFGSGVSGTIDLGGGALLWRGGGNTPDFRTLLTRGHNGGAWNGVAGAAGGAINSSLAGGSSQSDGIGYGLGSEIAPTSIAGFTIAPGDTLLRYTLDGDADLNQQVNLDDFTALAASFGTGNSWVRGDSNYDAAVNLNDFTALAANFGSSVGSVLPLAVRRPSPQPGDGPVFPFASLFSGRMIEIVDLN